MNDRIVQARDFVREAVQEPVGQRSQERYKDGFRRGFSSAAGITLRQIQERLDVFKEQMKGSGLTKVEQAVYVQLDELKSKIEADYDDFWRASGTDWRPIKPVAKGVVRRTEESLSED